MTAEPATLITVPRCATGSGTIRLVEEHICARVLDGVHFDHDYTFVRPEAKPIIREIADDVNRDLERQVLLVGHTDRSGSNAYNQALSESRARSVYGYVTNQPGIWMDLLRSMLDTGGGPRVARAGTGQSRDRWQTRELQYMLSYLRGSDGVRYYDGPIDNTFNAAVQAGLDRFRADNGIPAGGAPGPRIAGIDEVTWEAVIARYIAVDAAVIDPSRFLDPSQLGCGERFPRLETRAPGTASQDLADADARLETNRRVEFLLIPPSLVPASLTCELIYDNPASPVVICPDDPQPISVTLRFVRGDSNDPARGPGGGPLKVLVTGQGGFERQLETDEQGVIRLPDGETVQGEYRVSVEGSFSLALRDSSQGETRGAEVLLRLRQSAVVEIMVAAVAARLNFVEDAAAFDDLIDTLPDPLAATAPITFRLALDLEDAPGDLELLTVDLASFLLRGPASPVPDDGGGSGQVTPATPLEFVNAADQTVQSVALNTRFRLRLDTSEVVGDTVTVQLSSHWFRRQP